MRQTADNLDGDALLLCVAFATQVSKESVSIFCYKSKSVADTFWDCARLGRNHSTINREIARNSGLRGYRPQQAQQKALQRQQKPRTIKMTASVIAHIEDRLREDHSPEQVSGTMEKVIGTRISTERIYQHLWQDKREGGDLYTHLRIANGKKRRKRYGSKDYRGRILGRIDIAQRPAVVDEKTRLGDWEVDLVSGVKHQGFLVTLVERKSKFTLIGQVVKKTSAAVSAEILRLLKDLRAFVQTLTYDNGREFSGHQAINATLACTSYFATPYHSWERGLNENTNGLIRQYFPKGMDLREVSPERIAFVQSRLNNRPRKTLDFRTPQEVFSSLN